MSRRQSHGVALGLFLTMVCAVSSVAAQESAVVVDRIAARVEGQVVTASDVVRTLPIYLQVVGGDRSRLDTADGRDALAEEVMQYLVDLQLIHAHADERGVLPTSAEVSEYLSRQRRSMNMSEDAFARALASEGIEIEDFREFMGLLLTRMRMLSIDVASQVQVTEEDVQRVMEERFPDGLVEIRMSTRHLFAPLPRGASDEAEANALRHMRELQARLEAGESFSDLATENNPDPSARLGGRLGTFRLGELAVEYERAAMALEVGERSPIVRTPMGLHIIELLDRSRAPIADASQLQDRVRFELQQTEIDRQEALYLERLRNSAFVDIRMTDWGVVWQQLGVAH